MDFVVWGINFSANGCFLTDTLTHLFLQTGGQGEAPGTDRQEAPPFFTESIHIQVRVQPKVKSKSQIKSCFAEIFNGVIHSQRFLIH